VNDERRLGPRRLIPTAVLGGLFAVLTIVVTYPAAWNVDSLLGRVGQPGEPSIVGDGPKAVGYLVRGERTIEQGGSLWSLVLSNTRVHAPPGYVFVGSYLAIALGSAIVAHNWILFLSVFLGFCCMYALVHRITRDRVASVYAAVLFGFSNYVVFSAIHGHLNQIQTFWFPLAFLAVDRTLDRPGWKEGAALGAVLGGVALWVLHYAVFLAVLLPLYGVVRAPSRVRDLALIESLAVGAVVALAIAGYYGLSFAAAGPVERTLNANLLYSMQSPAQLVRPSEYFHIGLIPIGLALLALLGPADGRLLRLGYAAVGVFSIAMMLGPRSAFHPYTWFYESVPPFDMMRTPRRFIAPAMTACLVLAGIGLHRLRTAFPTRPRLARVAWVTACVGSLVASPALSTEYYRRSLEPGDIWSIEVTDLPYYLEETRR
jgi:hypothetical protein